MKLVDFGSTRRTFDVLGASASCQAAKMILRPGATSDESPSNEHRQSEQWMFVISGTGEARLGKKRSTLRKVKLSAKTLLLIEKGELHQIMNTGRSNLVTLNFYVPPAYGANNEPLRK